MPLGKSYGWLVPHFEPSNYTPEQETKDRAWKARKQRKPVVPAGPNAKLLIKIQKADAQARYAFHTAQRARGKRRSAIQQALAKGISRDEIADVLDIQSSEVASA